MHLDTPPRQLHGNRLRATGLLRHRNLPYTRIAPLAALLFGKAFHKAVTMGGESGHPAIFLLVYFLGVVPGKGRQIFKLFLWLVAVLMGGACAGQRALPFPDANPERAEIAVLKELHAVKPHGLHVLGAGSEQVVHFPADNLRMAAEVRRRCAQPFQPWGQPILPVVSQCNEGRSRKGTGGPLVPAKPRHILSRSGIAAEKAVVSKLPKVAGLSRGPTSRRNLRRRFLLVEIILYGLGGVKLVHQSVDFLSIEAGKGNVKSGGIQLGDDLGQLRLVPIALNPVQGKVQSLFFFRLQIHHNAVNLCFAHIQQHFQPLVAAHNIAGGPIPDHRLYKSKLLNGAFQFFIVLVAGLQIPARVVCCRVQPVSTHFLYQHFLLLHRAGIHKLGREFVLPP